MLGNWKQAMGIHEIFHDITAPFKPTGFGMQLSGNKHIMHESGLQTKNQGASTCDAFLSCLSCLGQHVQVSLAESY